LQAQQFQKVGICSKSIGDASISHYWSNQCFMESWFHVSASLLTFEKGIDSNKCSEWFYFDHFYIQYHIHTYLLVAEHRGVLHVSKWGRSFSSMWAESEERSAPALTLVLDWTETALQLSENTISFAMCHKQRGPDNT
jgi:hypothetical protein